MQTKCTSLSLLRVASPTCHRSSAASSSLSFAPSFFLHPLSAFFCVFITVTTNDSAEHMHTWRKLGIHWSGSLRLQQEVPAAKQESRKVLKRRQTSNAAKNNQRTRVENSIEPVQKKDTTADDHTHLLLLLPLLRWSPFHTEVVFPTRNCSNNSLSGVVVVAPCCIFLHPISRTNSSYSILTFSVSLLGPSHFDGGQNEKPNFLFEMFPEISSSRRAGNWEKFKKIGIR